MKDTMLKYLLVSSNMYRKIVIKLQTKSACVKLIRSSSQTYLEFVFKRPRGHKLDVY